MAEIAKGLAGALGSFVLTILGLAIALVIVGAIVFAASYVDLAPSP